MAYRPSKHLAFDSANLHRLGLKEGTSWKAQHEEDLLGGGESTQRILLIRHGEGLHNAAERRLGKEQWENVEAKKDIYFDPSLNEVGVQQCVVMGQHMDAAMQNDGLDIDCFIVSPLVRAIETARHIQAFRDHQAPILAMEICRERFGKNLCDKRRPLSELKKHFPGIDFDTHMESEEDPWFSAERETPEAVQARVVAFMAFIQASKFKSVCYIGHSDYMSNIVKVVGAGEHWPENCEVMSFMIE